MNTKAVTLLLFVLCVIAFSGCSTNSSSNTPKSENPVNTSDSLVPPPDLPLPEEVTPSNTPESSLELPPAIIQGTTKVKPQQATPTPILPPASAESGVSKTKPQQPANPPPASVESKPQEQPQEGETMLNINILVGKTDFIATMYDNESARAIVKEMPFTLKMDDYASQEKVTTLTFDLPSVKTETPARINAGEIYLWSGNNLVLFYTSFSNSYSYVPIGHITDIKELTDALGSGSVEVTFSAQ